MDTGMGFLARSVKHRPVPVLINRVTGVRARLGDSNGIRKMPISVEAIPHIRGELSRFTTLIPLHDPVTLPVGDRCPISELLPLRQTSSSPSQ